LKCFIFESNLHDDCKFKEELGLRAAKDTKYLLTRAQQHINYKEKKLEEEAPRSKQSNTTDDDITRNDKKKDRGSRPHPRDYTPLNASRETIL